MSRGLPQLERRRVSRLYLRPAPMADHRGWFADAPARPTEFAGPARRCRSHHTQPGAPTGGSARISLLPIRFDRRQRSKRCASGIDRISERPESTSCRSHSYAEARHRRTSRSTRWTSIHRGGLCISAPTRPTTRFTMLCGGQSSHAERADASGGADSRSGSRNRDIGRRVQERAVLRPAPVGQATTVGGLLTSSSRDIQNTVPRAPGRCVSASALRASGSQPDSRRPVFHAQGSVVASVPVVVAAVPNG